MAVPVFMGVCVVSISTVVLKVQNTRSAWVRNAWGEVQALPVTIVPAVEMIPELHTVPSRNPWFFPDWSTNQLADFIMGLPGLPAENRRMLARHIEPMPKINGSVLMPTDAEVIGLPPASRAKVYNILALHKINQNQDAARRFPAKSMRQWMKGVETSPETRKLLDQLAYRNGDFIFFADIPLVLERIGDTRERFEVYKALNRVATLNIKVRVREDDLAEAVSFWGGEGRISEVMPLLKAHADKGEPLDAIYLMPPFARCYLYQFPLRDNGSEAIRDCHWSAFNFFNWPDRLIEDVGGSMQQFIKSGYYTIPKSALKMGDVIVYLNERGDHASMIHSAVFICDDIVFTKNGSIWSSPWIFMREHQIADYYPTVLPMKKVYLRKKRAL